MSFGWSNTPIEIMGERGSPPTVALAALFDRRTGEFLVPLPPEEVRELMRFRYLQGAGATDQKFDQHWPRIWRLIETPYAEDDALTAVLDTGVMADRPLLKDCIRDVFDFTGEGIEDRTGHGTMVTLVARMIMPGVPRRCFVILKCTDANGKGTQENLIKAMLWM